MGDFIRFGYDVTDDFGDFHDDDLDAVRSASKWETLSRNATAFIIDISSPGIFESFQTTDPDEKVETTSLFKVALTCVSNFIRSKIICADRDFIACVLMGVAADQSSESDFKHINVLLPLELPGAKSVIAIEKLKENFADSKLGSGFDASFADAFWVVQNMFSRVTCSLSTKQVFLFTAQENPHATKSHLRKAMQQKVLDLANNSIEVDVLGLAPPDGFFDLALFWQSTLPQLKDKTTLPDPTVKIKELLYRVTTKEYTSRALSSIKVDLFGKEFAVKVFSFVNIARKPTGVKLDKNTNKEVFSRTEVVSNETGEVLMPDEIRFCQTFGSDKICLTKTEKDSLKYISDSGISILGFKSMDSLKFENYLRLSHFIYPDESSINGSLVLFQALLSSCVKQNVYAVCQVIAKSGAYPRLAALCPQQEVIQEDSGIQLKPPGFNVIYIPYAEDVRDLTLKIKQPRATARAEEIEAAKGVVNKLKINFDPENFRNPFLSRFYAYVEALALEKDSVDEPEDTINPSAEAIDSRLGAAGKAFVDCFSFKTAAACAGTKRKATAEASGGGKKPSVEVDTNELRKASKENKLGKFTVAVLKEACDLYMLSTDGRKQNLIDRLNNFFQSS